MGTAVRNDDEALPSSVQSPVTITVTFMGELPSLLGTRERLITLPPCATVDDLMKSLVEIFGKKFADRMFSSPGKLNHTVLIFVNGESIKRAGMLEARLGGDLVEVMLLPMFAGG